MTEEETFSKLRRIPYKEIEALWRFDPRLKGNWEIVEVWHGWTWREFCNEHSPPQRNT